MGKSDSHEFSCSYSHSQWVVYNWEACVYEREHFFHLIFHVDCLTLVEAL